MKTKKTPLLLFVTLGLSAPTVHAQIYWDGVSSAAWGTAANWSTASGATTPNPGAAPGAANDVVFNISTVNTTLTMNLNGNQSANSLTFRSTGGFTVAANTSAQSGNRTLTIGTGGISKTSNSGAVSINGNTANGAAGTGVITVTLGSATSQTWTNNSTTTALNVGTGFITAGGTNTAAVISLGAFAGANANTLTLDGDGNFNFGAATTSNAVITGTTGSLVKNGSGTLTLGGKNTYGGGTTINAGTLSLGATNVLPDASAIVLGGGTLLTGNTFTETAKSLSLTAASTITMGLDTGTTVLTFAEGVAGTSGISTVQVLSIWNWNGSLSGGGADGLFMPVGSLNSTELAGINFYSGVDNTGLINGGGAVQLGTGELVPVPEPGALASAMALAGTALLRRRRQA